MADDYIRKQDAVEALDELRVNSLDAEKGLLLLSGIAAASDIIESLEPVDVVPVIRCKDCKFRDNDDFCTGRGFPCQLVPDDGFCDKGERKE